MQNPLSGPLEMLGW